VRDEQDGWYIAFTRLMKRSAVALARLQAHENRRVSNMKTLHRDNEKDFSNNTRAAGC
jgi:hypothetical protein